MRAGIGVGLALLFTLAALVLVPSLGIALLAVLLLAGAVYYRRPKCGYCGARGQVTRTSFEVVNREQAYGIITRTDTVTKSRRLSDGTAARDVTHVNRQERVPIVRTTTRTHYQCMNCRNTWFRDTVGEAEDFSVREQAPQKETVVIQREVVKVPCKYCGMLVDPVRDAKCPSCGANLMLGKP